MKSKYERFEDWIFADDNDVFGIAFFAVTLVGILYIIAHIYIAFV